MFPKGALIGLCSGIVAGIVIGFYLANIANQAPSLVYVDGPSLSIITEKTNFKLGEDIVIRIVNSGTAPLTFSDSSYGLRIIGLDGSLFYSPVSVQVISVLEPREEKTFVWDQTKSDGEKINQGRYKIVSSTIKSEEKALEKSLVINILK